LIAADGRMVGGMDCVCCMGRAASDSRWLSTLCNHEAHDKAQQQAIMANIKLSLFMILGSLLSSLNSREAVRVAPHY